MNGTKGMKNMIWGIVSQIITIGLGIFIPRLVLVNLGSESNGLLSSIGSILTYMSLLEAGVGTATIQALYKPFSENDHDSINGIMSATNYFYKRTGYIYLTIVIILSVGYTAVVESCLPRIDVFMVVLLAGLSGVISYFFQGKYNIFLAAEGKGYITTNIATIISTGVSLCKAIVLINGGNVVMIQSVYFAFNLVQMLIITGYMNKNYPWIDLSVEPNFQAISQKNAVLVHQISGLVFNNTDVVLLTALTSLKTVSVYSMYNMIWGMVKSVAVTFSDSFVYVLGQSYHDRKKFLCIYDVYEIYNMAITFALFCITGVLILPFLRLYTSGVDDINYIDPCVAFLFIAMNLMSNGRKSSQTVINIAQHFEKTKWRSILESAINLTASVVLTKQFGIYGVLMGTIVALFYRTNDVIIYSARLLERSPLITYKRWGINWLLLILVVWVTSFFDFDLGNYVNLVIYGIALCITVIPVFVGVNSILEPQSAKYAFAYFKNMIKSRAAA